jgi:hypothetical protein
VRRHLLPHGLDVLPQRDRFLAGGVALTLQPVTILRQPDLVGRNRGCPRTLPWTSSHAAVTTDNAAPLTGPE